MLQKSNYLTLKLYPAQSLEIKIIKGAYMKELPLLCTEESYCISGIKVSVRYKII